MMVFEKDKIIIRDYFYMVSIGFILVCSVVFDFISEL
jgi:hypothetical protein